MMSKTKIVSFVAVAFMILGAGCSQSNISSSTTVDKSPIKIGWIGPLTGDFSGPGTDALKASQLAVSEVNASGGVKGRPLQLIVEDGQANPKVAATAASKLINVDQVSVVMSLTSGESLSVAPLAEAKQVVLISGCASAPGVSNAGDYTFRTFPSDAYQGKFGAEYVYNTLGKRKVATLAIQTDYGLGIKKTFEDSFAKLGGTITASEEFTQDSRDLKTQLTRIKSSGAEALYLVGYTETSLVALKEIKELGLNMPIMSPDSFDDSKVYSSGLAEGVKYSVPGFATSDDWKAKMKAAGANTTACSPRSYDNVKLLANVMSKVGTDGINIKNALYQIKDFSGVGGPITFDVSGDPTDAYYDVMVVKSGKTEVVK